MELSPINACIVATTVIDQVGQLHHKKQRHTRVTRQSIKRLLHTELAEAPLGHIDISVCAAVTRIDDFLGIEVVLSDGTLAELGIIELQRSLVDQLRKLSGGVFPGPNARAFESIRRPMTRISHGEMVDRLELTPDASPNTTLAFGAGLDALGRSLALPDTAGQLGVQWTKSKMLDIRVDANLAYIDRPSLMV